MKLPRIFHVPDQRRDPHPATTDVEHDEHLAEIETRVDNIVERAERVVADMSARMVRNQWTETVQQIARTPQPRRRKA